MLMEALEDSKSPQLGRIVEPTVVENRIRYSAE